MPALPVLPLPAGLASCWAAATYDPTLGTAVVGLKNADRRAQVTPFADALAPLVPDQPGLVLTWAPTGALRRARRGFDHAELLARAVARRRRLPVAALLRRRGGPAQAGRSAAERRVGPALEAVRRCPWPVLVIDDVATTGATLSAAAEALRRAGSPAVHGLVVARAPLRSAR